MSRSCGVIALGLDPGARTREIGDAARLLGTEPTPATSVAGLRAAPTQTLGESVRAEEMGPLSTRPVIGAAMSASAPGPYTRGAPAHPLQPLGLLAEAHPYFDQSLLRALSVEGTTGD